MDVLGVARKWALENAHKHGSAKVGSVVSKVVGELPDAKSELNVLMPKIKQVVDDVNKLSADDVLKELESFPELLEKRKVVEVKELKPLKDAVQGKVVMRVAPSPSGPLHIGHAFVLGLNHRYCEMYDGRLIVRIDDTNPENIYPPAYELIPKDARWLTNNEVHKVVCQSDRMESYYKYGERLVKEGHAYVCTCVPDAFRALITKKQACPCREQDALPLWQKMFEGFKPGEAVLRIKTDVSDPNPALRDWPAFRINEAEHPRQGKKYRVWPLMNFAVAVDDHELGITHTVRGIDHIDNARRQSQVFGFFGWKVPVHEYFGKINFEGLELSASKTREKIEQGVFDGWDDIRLPFLEALRRRGYQPGAFIKFAVEMGINKSEKTVPVDEFFKLLNAFNRDIIDPVAPRYFFVDDPVEVIIEGLPEKVCELPVHPDHPERGVRKLRSSGRLLLARDDVEQLKDGKLYRLMGCGNFTKKGGKYVFAGEDYEEFRERGDRIMHWLPENVVDVEVLMPDKTVRRGKGESTLKNLSAGNVVQFERFGFVRCDKIEKKFMFWFAHK